MKWMPTSIMILISFGTGIVFGARSPYAEVLKAKQNTSSLAVSCNPSISGKAITAQEFEQVKEGMTFAQVKQILGEPTQSTTIDTGNIKIVSYVWIVGNQSFGVGFENDSVVSRVQTSF